MRARTIGWLIFAACIVVTLAAVALAASRGEPDETVAAGLGLGNPGTVAVVKLDGAITDAMVTPERRRDNLMALLRRVERDQSVRAVVLRVNSPGGSATASQALYDQIRRLQAGGKKVVVYFADVAASGGYYVGAAGDRIVAQPATITGSIGVIITTIDLQGLYEKIGVRERVIKSGPYKDILSGTRDMTPDEEAILQRLVDDTLAQFVTVVAEGRHMPEAEVRAIADGRVVSGAEALRLRLVDELGDERRAVALAAELAGLKGEPRVVVLEEEREASLLNLLGTVLPGVRQVEELAPEPGISVRYEWRGAP